jgi:hypothetical protein
VKKIGFIARQAGINLSEEEIQVSFKPFWKFLLV